MSQELNAVGAEPDALEQALRSGDLEAVRRAAGARRLADVQDDCGTPLLILAVYFAPPGLVDSLLAEGCDANVDPGDGFPSLFAAIDRADGEGGRVLTALLAAGADVQQRGMNDYTPLHYAACRDHAEAVALLLAHGADPAARTRIDHYATPLEEAERFGHEAGAAALRQAASPQAARGPG